MPKTKNPPSDVDTTVEYVVKRFNSSRDYVKKYFSDTWSQSWDLYNNKRVFANYEGNSDGFVPETFTLIQAVKAHIIGPNLRIQFLPRSPDQRGDIKVLNNLMDFIMDQDHTAMKTDFAAQDCLVTGNGYLFQHIVAYEDVYLPCNRYVPTEDAFFDPQAKSYDELRYCGYRYLTTLKELKGEEITNESYDEADPKSTLKVSRYQNLDKVEPGFSEKDDKTAKSLREEMLGGATLNDKNDLVECIVYYDFEKMITIANRTVVIEDIDTPCKRAATKIMSHDNQGNPMPVDIPEIEPFLPVAPFRDYADGAMFYAKGDVEVIAELQERLNDTQNQKTDNLSFIMNRMWALDPAYAQKIDEIQNVPGAVFTVPPGALEAIVTPPLGQDADNEMYRIKDEMRRATAADELIQGAQQSKGTITATEANIQVNQAGTRFDLKLNFLENEGFRIMAENMFKLMQIYITQEMAVRMVGSQGIEWKSYNPGEFMGDYDVKVMLKSNAIRAQETEKQNAMQFFLLASKLRFVNQMNLFKDVAMTLFDKDENQIDALFQPVPPGIIAMDKMVETMDYEKTPPDIKAQMEMQTGFQPSAVHAAEMQALGLPMPNVGQDQNPQFPVAPTMPPPGMSAGNGAPPPGVVSGQPQGANMVGAPQGPA